MSAASSDLKGQQAPENNLPANGSKIRAEQLKAEGNALHAKGSYKKAYAKYSEAIKHDRANAILFANRAACSIKMKEYLDASLDATKAVQIDPQYAKAWARLAEASDALSNWDKSVDAWQKALASLQRANLSSSEQAVRLQCETGLQKTIEAKADRQRSSEIKRVVNYRDQFPWMKALAMEQELVQKQIGKSSAWSLISAYKQFAEGVETMKLTHMNADGQVLGRVNAMVNLTNAVLEEPRVFHMEGSVNWPVLFNRQASFEASYWKALAPGGLATMKKEAVLRLKKDGWDNLHPALSFTVRAWIMRAFLGSQTGLATPGTVLDLYRLAIGLLEWGRHEWKDVCKETRGTIFEQTFLRGVKQLYLDTMIESLPANLMADAPCSLEDLNDVAQDLLVDSRHAMRVMSPALSPAWVNSFYVYPLGTALSALGFYHSRKASDAASYEEMHKQFGEAAEYYLQAAEWYPEDDEKHAYFLKIALECYWNIKAPLSTTLPLARRVKAAIPKFKTIWAVSQFAQARGATLQQALNFQEEYSAKVDREEVDLNAKIGYAVDQRRARDI